MKFELDVDQQKKVNDWVIENYPYGLPYTGAAGGHLEYMFFPTSIGVFITIKDVVNGKELDVSDV